VVVVVTLELLLLLLLLFMVGKDGAVTGLVLLLLLLLLLGFFTWTTFGLPKRSALLFPLLIILLLFPWLGKDNELFAGAIAKGLAEWLLAVVSLKSEWALTTFTALPLNTFFVLVEEVALLLLLVALIVLLVLALLVGVLDIGFVEREGRSSLEIIRFVVIFSTIKRGTIGVSVTVIGIGGKGTEEEEGKEVLVDAISNKELASVLSFVAVEETGITLEGIGRVTVTWGGGGGAEKRSEAVISFILLVVIMFGISLLAKGNGGLTGSESNTDVEGGGGKLTVFAVVWEVEVDVTGKVVGGGLAKGSSKTELVVFVVNVRLLLAIGVIEALVVLLKPVVAGALSKRPFETFFAEIFFLIVLPFVIVLFFGVTTVIGGIVVVVGGGILNKSASLLLLFLLLKISEISLWIGALLVGSLLPFEL
jgi:hypothetical protein